MIFGMLETPIVVTGLATLIVPVTANADAADMPCVVGMFDTVTVGVPDIPTTV